jgi:hypothetical protein
MKWWWWWRFEIIQWIFLQDYRVFLLFIPKFGLKSDYYWTHQLDPCGGIPHIHLSSSTSFLFVGCTRKPYSTAIADSWSLLSAGNSNEHTHHQTTRDAVTAKLFSTRTNLKALEALLGLQLKYWQWTVGWTLPVKNLLRHPIGKSLCCECGSRN